MAFSTQQSIDIAGIKEGIVILKNGGYRIILSVSTINFALKSEQEQTSLIFQYQSFLNSLHFPIEIVMRSKRLDLTPYLQKVEQLAQNQENELLKMQTEDYVDFVGKLITLANIMKKNFYVSIGYQPTAIKASFLDKLFNKQKTFTELKISEEEFKHNSEELRQRASITASGLAGMGLRCVQLATEEIIELFYQIYNPEIAGKERVTDAGALSAPMIEHASEKPKDKVEKAEEEVKIDNSAEVKETERSKAAERQQEALKTGERQIAGVQSAPNKPAAEPAKNAEKPQPPAPQPPV